MSRPTTTRAQLQNTLRPLAGQSPGHTIQRLLGFWMIWHTFGDLHAIVAAGMLKRDGVYRSRADFLKVFGCNVEDFNPELAAVIVGQRHVSASSLIGKTVKVVG